MLAQAANCRAALAASFATSSRNARRAAVDCDTYIKHEGEWEGVKELHRSAHRIITSSGACRGCVKQLKSLVVQIVVEGVGARDSVGL